MEKLKQVRSGAGSAAEVRPPPKKRRVFGAAEKLRIVREAEACGPGELGALLRREGSYSSHLSTWRKALGVHGTAGLGEVKRGRKAKYDAKDRRIQELEKQLRASGKELAIRQALIELQKRCLGPSRHHAAEPGGVEMQALVDGTVAAPMTRACSSTKRRARSTPACSRWASYGTMRIGLISMAALLASCGATDALNVPPQAAASQYRQPSLDLGTTQGCQSGSGRLACWGNEFQGAGPNPLDPKEIANLGYVQQVVTGGSHICVVVNGGDVKCWGNNFERQLDSDPWGPPWSTPTPNRISLPTRTARAFVGGAHTCAIDDRGGVRCWGRNTSHESAPMSAEAVAPPTRVDLPLPAQSGCGGSRHSCAVLDNGEVWCWGTDGSFGPDVNASPLGHPGTTPGAVDAQMSIRFVAVACGYDMTCGLTMVGEVWCWGGAFGASPSRLAGLEVPAAQITGRYSGFCAVLRNGSAACWGNAASGSLGDGRERSGFVRSAVSVVGVTNAIDIARGWSDCGCVLTADRKRICWGWCEAGAALGRHLDEPQYLPAEFPWAFSD